MRLSNEKARRLSALVWRERARRWLLALVALLAVAGAATYMLSRQVERADRTLEVREREGTVVSIKQGGSRGASVVRVHLGDGREVDAHSASRLVLPPGSQIVIAETRHVSGRLTSFVGIVRGERAGREIVPTSIARSLRSLIPDRPVHALNPNG